MDFSFFFILTLTLIPAAASHSGHSGRWQQRVDGLRQWRETWRPWGGTPGMSWEHPAVAQNGPGATGSESGVAATRRGEWGRKWAGGPVFGSLLRRPCRRATDGEGCWRPAWWRWRGRPLARQTAGQRAFGGGRDGSAARASGGGESNTRGIEWCGWAWAGRHRGVGCVGGNGREAGPRGCAECGVGQGHLGAWGRPSGLCRRTHPEWGGLGRST